MENQQVKAGEIHVEDRFLDRMHKVREEMKKEVPLPVPKLEEDV